MAGVLRSGVSVPERRSQPEESSEEDYLEIQSRLEDWYEVRVTDDPQVKKDRLERANFALGLVLDCETDARGRELAGVGLAPGVVVIAEG